MAIREVVRILRTFYQDDGATLRARHGAAAVAVAEDALSMLAIRLREESPYASLWERFTQDPLVVAAELTGALEALVEADPALARRLDAFVRKYHAAIAPQPPTTASPVAAQGDTLDVAVGAEALDETDERRPYEPNTASEGTFDASVDRGTYLYGNVKSGQESPGRAAGAEPFDFGARVLGARAGGTQLVDVRGVPPLFTRLVGAVNVHPALVPARKQEIKTILRGVQEEVMRVEDADPDRLAQHLRALQRMAPDIAQVLLDIFSTAELGGAVQRAVERATERV